MACCPTCGQILRQSVTSLVLRYAPDEEWDVETIKAAIHAVAPNVTEKQIFNALGNLTRRKRLRRLSYGRYSAN